MENNDKEVNRIERIKGVLEKLNHNYDSLPKMTKHNLEKIDLAVDQLIEYEKAISIENSRVYASINNVAKITGISNKTFQNNIVLKKFLEVRQADFRKVDVSYELTELRHNNNELQRMVDIFTKKDIECEPLRRRIVILEEENKELMRRNSELSGTVPVVSGPDAGSGHHVRLKDIRKVITWNVNGFKKRSNEIRNLIDTEGPDFLCLQEIRSSSIEDIRGYHKYEHPGNRKGYSGVAVYSRHRAKSFNYYNDEGRIIVLEFDDFVLVNAYVPTIGTDHARKQYRFEFDLSLQAILSKIDLPVILCGDMNAAPEKIDALKYNTSFAGQTDDEVSMFHKYNDMGYVDMMRKLHPGISEYTWNSQLRLDYFLLKDIRRVEECWTLRYGTSDHIPVYLEFDNSNQVKQETKLVS